jgi:CDP-paratose 2-epimerase
VYNIGGGRFSNCSMLEAIDLCQDIAGRELRWTYSDINRIGDHIWYIGDNGRFARHYPQWTQRYNVPAILRDIHAAMVERWTDPVERSAAAATGNRDAGAR